MARATTLLVLASLSLSTVAAQGAEAQAKKPSTQMKPAQPDIKFLEYLGTLESDEENWTEIAALALAPPESKPNAKPEAAAKSAAEKK
jgi:hypothetical protein